LGGRKLKEAHHNCFTCEITIDTSNPETCFTEDLHSIIHRQVSYAPRIVDGSFSKHTEIAGGYNEHHAIEMTGSIELAHIPRYRQIICKAIGSSLTDILVHMQPVVGRTELPVSV
jgi:hypothetical protein